MRIGQSLVCRTSVRQLEFLVGIAQTYVNEMIHERHFANNTTFSYPPSVFALLYGVDRDGIGDRFDQTRLLPSDQDAEAVN